MASRPADSIVPAFADASLRHPVFVVGMNGSGTTMLVDCLGNHPELYGFPLETRLIPHLMRVAGDYAPLEDDDNFRRLWRYAAGLAPFRLASGGEPMGLPAGWQSCSRDLAGLLNMLFLSFAAPEGKFRWCEKSPQNAQHMLKLQHLYPQAKFVHVIRDGRDCACSFHRRWRRSPELTMIRWKKLVEAARLQGEQLAERYLEVHYEELTTEPELWMPRVCEFLNVPFDPVVLESSQPYLSGSRDYRRQENTGRLQSNSGRWRSYFSKRLGERLNRIGGRMLAECGYETCRPEADETPPRWRQGIWRVADGAYQFYGEVRSKLRGRIERPWWSILSRPLNAYRQEKENWF